uniref:Rad21/Rec8-like protein N-terminal domain-containing protein n=1 Tax=Scleropages formosus TaxID=113540 RepID=A0A8C9WPF1_SCLFO
MFYYPNVLQRHTGRFSIIWLAATKGIKIPRRDYLSVNIHRTCNDIMDYVLVRAPPIQPGLPRPRFSLYLSAQLQYGVILVYHRQCAILLEEIQHTIDRLLRFKRKARIDLEEPDRMALILPDVLATLEESERAQDPFFGMMGPGYELPSPSTLVQQWQLEKEPFPEPPVPVLPAPENGITASPESITITEAAAVPEAEFEGVELPQVTPTEMDIIEMLMEQQDEFPGEEEERELVREMETEVTREEPAPVVSAERLRVTAAEDEETMWLLDEETGLPVEVPVAVPVEKTPTRVTLPPSPPEREAEEPRDVRRERERVGEMERVLPR